MAHVLYLTQILPCLLNAGERVRQQYALRNLSQYHPWRQIYAAWDEVYSGLVHA